MLCSLGPIIALSEPQTKESATKAVLIAGQQLQSLLHGVWPEDLGKRGQWEREQPMGSSRQAGCAWGPSGRSQGLEGDILPSL